MNDILQMLQDCDLETIKEIAMSCDKIIDQNYEDDVNKKYAENQKLVGKCYREKLDDDNERFYKVISIKSNNMFRVSCLCFNKKIDPEFSNFYRINGSTNDNQGYIIVDTIDIDDPMVVDLIGYEEITKEEYNQQMIDYVRRLQNYDWSVV